MTTTVNKRRDVVVFDTDLFDLNGLCCNESNAKVTG